MNNPRDPRGMTTADILNLWPMGSHTELLRRAKSNHQLLADFLAQDLNGKSPAKATTSNGKKKIKLTQELDFRELLEEIAESTWVSDEDCAGCHEPNDVRGLLEHLYNDERYETEDDLSQNQMRFWKKVKFVYLRWKSKQ